MERERELAVLDSAQVALHELAGLEAGQQHAGLGRPLRQNLATCGSSTNSSSTGRRFLRAEEDVKIADRLGPAPQAAAELGADDLAMAADGLQDRRHQQECLICRIRPPDVSRNAIPSRMLASVLAPKPLILAICPASAAARRSARLLILSVSCRTLIFLGPKPGTRRSARIPGGVAFAACRRPATDRSSQAARSWRASSRRSPAPPPGCRRRSSPRGPPASS